MAALLSAAIVTSIVGPATGVQLPGPCALHRGADETIRHFARRLIVCAVQRFGPTPGGTTRAVCIARRESGLDPTATSSPKGIYVGLYQHDRRMWPSRYTRYTRPAWELPESPLNGRTNAIVTIRMVRAFGRWKAAGWPPKGC